MYTHYLLGADVLYLSLHTHTYHICPMKLVNCIVQMYIWLILGDFICQFLIGLCENFSLWLLWKIILHLPYGLWMLKKKDVLVWNDKWKRKSILSLLPHSFRLISDYAWHTSLSHLNDENSFWAASLAQLLFLLTLIILFAQLLGESWLPTVAGLLVLTIPSCSFNPVYISINNPFIQLSSVILFWAWHFLPVKTLNFPFFK